MRYFIIGIAILACLGGYFHAGNFAAITFYINSVFYEADFSFFNISLGPVYFINSNNERNFCFFDCFVSFDSLGLYAILGGNH